MRCMVIDSGGKNAIESIRVFPVNEAKEEPLLSFRWGNIAGNAFPKIFSADLFPNTFTSTSEKMSY